jgi:hypothetical protein
MGNTVNDTTKKAVCSGFFLLAADNLVADPSPEHYVQIRPTKETTTTVSPILESME